MVAKVNCVAGGVQAAGFYDRNPDTAALKTHLKNPPAKLTVIVGPQACGKTVLIQHVLETLGFGASRISYIDTRYAWFCGHA